MTRRYAILLILGISGLFLLFNLKDTDKGKGGVITSPKAVDKSVNEDAIAAVASGRPTQVTEISSHGEERATVARELREPKNKINLTVLKPEERRVAQSASLLSGTSWMIWEGVAARPKDQGVPSSYLVEVSGYYIVSDAAAISDERHFSPQQPLVLYNKRKGIAGVLTGTLQLVLKEGVSIEDVASSYGLTVLDSLPEMKMYFVTSASHPFDIVSLKESLVAEPGIARVELEILSRQYVKN